MNYSVGGAGHLMEIKLGDGMTKESFRALWSDIERHPLYADATSVLVLFQPVIKWHLSASEMMFLARESRRFKPMRWAIVAHDQLSFGMSRVFASQVDDENTYFVSYDEKQAREWLASLK